MDILGTFTLQMNRRYYIDRKKRCLKMKIVTMVVVSLCLFQPLFAQDEESQCEAFASENCIEEVRCTIGKKSAEIRKSYTLSMFTLYGNEEPVAFFDYVGQEFYNCDPATGYVCNKKNETVFSVTTLCAPSTKFSFFAEGEKSILCMSIQKKWVSELDLDSNKPGGFQDDVSGNSYQMNSTTVVAVCIGVISSITTATILYVLLKRGILSTYFEKKRSRDEIEAPDSEKKSSLSYDKIDQTEIDYKDEQCPVHDDPTVTQERS